MEDWAEIRGCAGRSGCRFWHRAALRISRNTVKSALVSPRWAAEVPACGEAPKVDEAEPDPSCWCRSMAPATQDAERIGWCIRSDAQRASTRLLYLPPDPASRDIWPERAGDLWFLMSLCRWVRPGPHGHGVTCATSGVWVACGGPRVDPDTHR